MLLIFILVHLLMLPHFLNSQVLGHIENLCARLFLSDKDVAAAAAVEGAYPPLTFPWVQVILQCLLRGQLMAIRKHALKLILS